MAAIPGAEKFVADLELDESKIASDLTLHDVADTDVDAVTFEILRHKYSHLVEEMGSTIQNISGSVVATDALDFQTTIADERGSVIEIGPYVFILGGGLDLEIKWILENRSHDPGIEPGDMFICNDPWIGAVHQNDVALVSPIFHEDELFSWTAVTVHQVDIGGADPGSFVPSADDVFSESTPMPPTKIVEGGEIREDIEDLYLRRSRTPPALGLDLRAKIAANNVARDRVHDMIDEWGAETVKASMKHSLEYTENRLRNRIETLPDGVWRHENYMEVAKIGDRGVYRTNLEMRNEGDTLTFRVTGDEQVGMINCTYSGLRGGIYTPTLPLLAYDMPWSPSAFDRVIEIETDDNIVVNAGFPGAVSMATVSGAWHMQNSATLTISKMLAASDEHDQDLIAGTDGGCPNVAMLGLNSEGDPFADIFMETMAGGWGARSFDDGIDTGGVMQAPRGQCPTVERTESEMPVLYMFRRELADSGGAGKYRGGVGGEIGWKAHDVGGPDAPPIPLDLTLTAFGVAFPPIQGICGGQPPNSNVFTILRDSGVTDLLESGEVPGSVGELGELELLPPKHKLQLHHDDFFRFTWGGGGGYGDPIDRDPNRVREDVVQGYVSEEAAHDIYGVVLSGEGPDREVDEAATEEWRSEIRDQRRADAEAVEVS